MDKRCISTMNIKSLYFIQQGQ